MKVACSNSNGWNGGAAKQRRINSFALLYLLRFCWESPLLCLLCSRRTPPLTRFAKQSQIK